MRPLGCILDDFRGICRTHGYALAEHGSKRRDYDLIACPWTKDAKAASTLVRALMQVEGVQLVLHGRRPKQAGISAILAEGRRANKPHGRLGWVFHLQPLDMMRPPWYIDLSVMPRST